MMAKSTQSDFFKWGHVCYICLYLCYVKRYKVKEVISMLEKDGWYMVAQKGSHRQYKHRTKSGRVTINEKPSTTLDQDILNSIWKQTGWK